VWYILAEHRWCIFGEHAWYIFGEHPWCILGEHPWYIYVRLLTDVAHDGYVPVLYQTLPGDTLSQGQPIRAREAPSGPGRTALGRVTCQARRLCGRCDGLAQPAFRPPGRRKRGCRETAPAPSRGKPVCVQRRCSRRVRPRQTEFGRTRWQRQCDFQKPLHLGNAHLGHVWSLRIFPPIQPEPGPPFHQAALANLKLASG